MYANVAKARKVVTKGLVSYWSFDKSSIRGKVVKDVWGDNDGEIKGDPKVVAGKIGEALRFDGQNDYIHIPNDDSLKPLGGFTISACIKADSLDNMWIASKAKSTDYGYGLWIFDNKPGFSVHSAPGVEWGLHSSAEISTGKWYHIVGVYLNPMSKIYVNGELKGIHNEATLTTGDKNLIIGYAEDPGTLFGHFNGLIDEVSIYNRVLSKDEIKQNFAAKAGLAVVYHTEKLGRTWGEIKVSR